MKEAYSKAQSMKMIKRDTRWTLVFEDFDYGSFSKNSLKEQTNFMEMRHGDNCCIIKNEQGNCQLSLDMVTFRLFADITLYLAT